MSSVAINRTSVDRKRQKTDLTETQSQNSDPSNKKERSIFRL
jgi:hypothetical protein